MAYFLLERLPIEGQKDRNGEGRDTYGQRERVYKLSNDATDPSPSVPGGYISFVAHFWVGDNGRLIRGTIEDAHTGMRLALDLSEVLAFLQTSLAHSPGQTTQDFVNTSLQKNHEETAGPGIPNKAEVDESE
jgi:hypothetical protein